MAGLLLLEHVPMSARRVLDLGCGPGFPTFELAERLGGSARVVGVDPWSAALRELLDRRARLAGELRLTVPMVVLPARA
jgi:trans-aconitate methyltransferase